MFPGHVLFFSVKNTGQIFLIFAKVQVFGQMIIYHYSLQIQCSRSLMIFLIQSTAAGQAVTCAPVMQWARVRSPVGTSFLGEVFSAFSSPIRQMSGSFRPLWSPNIIWLSLSSPIIIHTGANDLSCWRALKPWIYIHTNTNMGKDKGGGVRQNALCDLSGPW